MTGPGGSPPSGYRLSVWLDIFERGPKLFGLVARDLFDMRSWRPPW
ncbi:hypothetical protein ACN27J_30960 [Solwaraspora sp. WMMB762]